MIRKEAYIFVGPPGSGKGSLSKLCTESFGWAQLSTGDLCRKHITEGTEIGRQIDFTIKSGKLVSDELITCLVDEWLYQMMQEDKVIILDGFPRNVVQVDILSNLLGTKYSSLKIKVIRFHISDEIAIQRICSRYVCSNKHCQTIYSINPASGLAARNQSRCDTCDAELGRRADDCEEIVLKRLKLYRDFEKEMLARFVNLSAPIIDIHVERSLSDVFNSFKKEIIDIEA